MTVLPRVGSLYLVEYNNANFSFFLEATHNFISSVAMNNRFDFEEIRTCSLGN